MTRINQEPGGELGVALQRIVGGTCLGESHGHPALRIVGAGNAGARMVDALFRTGVQGDVQFFSATWSATGVNHSPNPGYPREPAAAEVFNTADIVIILVEPCDSDAVSVVQSIMSIENRSDALVVVLFFERPTFGQGEMLAALPADARVLLIPLPLLNSSVCTNGLDSRIAAIVDGLSEGFNASALGVTDLRTVLEDFVDVGKVQVGLGVAQGENRVARAVARAAEQLAIADSQLGSGILLLVAGSQELAIREVSAIVDAVSGFFCSFAGCSLGVNYDERMGDLLRVTLVISEPSQRRLTGAQLASNSTAASDGGQNQEAAMTAVVSK
jgi:cell division protein FtsZ